MEVVSLTLRPLYAQEKAPDSNWTNWSQNKGWFREKIKHFLPAEIQLWLRVYACGSVAVLIGAAWPPRAPEQPSLIRNGIISSKRERYFDRSSSGALLLCIRGVRGWNLGLRQAVLRNFSVFLSRYREILEQHMYSLPSLHSTSFFPIH